MKVITIQRISTLANDYGTVKEEMSLEVPDNYNETISDEKCYRYNTTENLSEYSIVPLILALISILLSLIYFLIR